MDRENKSAFLPVPGQYEPNTSGEVQTEAEVETPPTPDRSTSDDADTKKGDISRQKKRQPRYLVAAEQSLVMLKATKLERQKRGIDPPNKRPLNNNDLRQAIFATDAPITCVASAQNMLRHHNEHPTKEQREQRTKAALHNLARESAYVANKHDIIDFSNPQLLTLMGEAPAFVDTIRQLQQQDLPPEERDALKSKIIKHNHKYVQYFETLGSSNLTTQQLVNTITQMYNATHRRYQNITPAEELSLKSNIKGAMRGLSNEVHANTCLYNMTNADIYNIFLDEGKQFAGAQEVELDIVNVNEYSPEEALALERKGVDTVISVTVKDDSRMEHIYHVPLDVKSRAEDVYTHQTHEGHYVDNIHRYVDDHNTALHQATGTSHTPHFDLKRKPGRLLIMRNEQDGRIVQDAESIVERNKSLFLQTLQEETLAAARREDVTSIRLPKQH